MKLIDQIFKNTISEYNKNASDINKFKFSEFEKIVFKNMMEGYAEQCIKASLECAKRTIELREEDGYFFESKTITNSENIVLL